MYKQINSVLIALLISAVAIAQENSDVKEPLVTDRPDVTEASSTVLKGALQIETGAFYTSSEENGVKQEVLGYNTTLLRYGILENFELRLGWNFEEGRTTINGMELMDITSGFSPLLVGMKVQVTEEKGLMPEVALVGHIYLPFTAGSDYRPETTGADFRIAASHTISEKSGIGYNLGAAWRNDSPEANFLYSVSYGYSVSDKIGLYAEVYGDFPENSRANHFWDAGITYRLSNDLQLDATVGTGINEGQDILISGGVSYRILN
jgi:hypothetical protein